MLSMHRLGVARCARGHDAAWPRGVRRSLSGCPECPLIGQREPIGRIPDTQTNLVRGSPGIPQTDQLGRSFMLSMNTEIATTSACGRVGRPAAEAHWRRSLTAATDGSRPSVARRRRAPAARSPPGELGRTRARQPRGGAWCRRPPRPQRRPAEAPRATHRPANYAVKLSALRVGYSTIISASVYESLYTTSKYASDGRDMWTWLDEEYLPGRALYGSNFWWQP